MNRPLLVLGLLFSIWTTAQAQSATLFGRVADSKEQKSLAGALLQLQPGDRQTISEEDGAFSLRGLPAGTYTLRVSLMGFEPFQKEITLREGARTAMDIALEPGAIEIKGITVQPAAAHRRQMLSQLDIQLRPILNSQEVLRMVPGLFIGQHAGGGKAEQIFLRGFDIDHGTDIQLSVDGMPVNMVSHAHGQGYADLHFVIPELIDQVQFEKGPYRADKGNFVTAGWAAFRTKETLDRNFAKVELGQYGTARAVAGVNLLPGTSQNKRHQSAYIAGEYSYSDSYFDAPQFFNRVNVQARYAGDVSAHTRMILTASHFWSRWNHSGQIPDRAVAAGDISFFGSIDPTEGGETGRTNLNAEFSTHTAGGGMLKNQVFYGHYDFQLYSNFTFFLEDSINGDQIRQKESRHLLGYNGSYLLPNHIGGKDGHFTAGIQYRQDLTSDSELSHSLNRVTTVSQVQFGDVKEANVAAYMNQEWRLTKKITVEAGLRYDQFFNHYTDMLGQETQRKAKAGTVSPKLNFSWTPTERVQLYLNTGRGFHSNDTRVVVPQQGREILPAAYGADLGTVLKPVPGLLVNAALWYLWLDQEFVYVGDAGIVEPGGQTRRSGLDLTARYQIIPHLFADADLCWTRPRAVGEPSGANLIPLAPVFTATGGLSLTGIKGWNGSLRFRYMGDRPANEDNSIVAEGYFVPDLQVNYTQKKWEIGLNVQNLTNTRWKETQFATESRLRNEPEPVEEIHFTPGTPLFARMSFTLFF